MRTSTFPLPRAMRTITLSALLLGTGFMITMLQSGALRMRYEALPSVSQTIAAPTAPAAPTAFDQEVAMGPKALLDRWNPVIEEAAEKFHLPAAWIRAVIRQESGGRTMLAQGLPITSDAGAMGVMQLMPSTYGQMARHYQLGHDPYNPHDNVIAGAAYLRWLHGRYGFPAMFAAYNDGPGLWESHIHHRRPLPMETRNYIKSITHFLGDATKVKLTRPNGTRVAIDAMKVVAVHAARPGEYPPSVHAVIRMGRKQQAVREDVAFVSQRLRQSGAPV